MATDTLFEIGNGASFGARTNAITVLKNGKMGLGDTSPDGALLLDVEGPVGATQFCDEAGSNCFTAASVGGGSSLWIDETAHISAASASVHVIKAGQALPGDMDDTGTRLFWYQDKGALRGGSIVSSNDAWQESNVGSGSVAFGTNSEAKGNYSAAFGYGSTASGPGSIAAGAGTASGQVSFAMGDTAQASGDYSFAFGPEATAAAFGFAFGYSADAVGAGAVALSLDSMVMGSGGSVSGNDSLGVFLGPYSGPGVASDQVMAIMGGNVGIGIVAPSVALDVEGDIEYTGVIADVSDSRLKTKIEELLPHQGDAIGALRPVSFEMKDREGVREFGFIAQDVEQVFPELVQETDAGVKSLNYVGLIAPMVKSIQQLKQENAALRARLDAIEANKRPPVLSKPIKD